MAKDAVAEYLKQFKKSKDHYEKDLSQWTDEELTEHYKELDKYYGRSIRTDNLLGRFDDPNHDYYWHTIEENNPIKLERRLSIGWSIVQSEESVGMKRSQDASRLGSSSMIQDVKGGDKAILLKIPKALSALNQRVKEAKANKKALFDHNGNPLKISETSDEHRVIQHLDAGLTEPFEVDLKH